MENPEDMQAFLQAAITATVNVAQPTLANQFKIHLSQFIAKLLKIYKNIPDQKAAQCIPQIETQANIVEQLPPKTLIVNFHTVASSQFSSEMERDLFMQDRLTKIPLFSSLHISEFWPHIPEETKESIWKYITKLWSLAAEYNACNDRDKIGGQAMDLLQTPRFHSMMESILGTLETPGGTQEEVESDDA
jgi:hypothetical protein